MKFLGQLLIALLGGIIAILLYRYFERDDEPRSYSFLPGSALNRTVAYREGVADSINNVFNIGFGAAAESTLNQVVHIRSQIIARSPRDPFREFFGDGFWEQQQQRNQWQQMQVSAGSGVIISEDGYIVTNNHVIDNAREVAVSLYNGRNYKAKLVGADPSTDLAILKIDEKNLPVTRFANSDKVRVGDWVLAVGNPFNLASTVTAGIVSAKARNIHILSDNSAIESFIQTDAAVNPGNSGGALVNLNGELIGINTAIATPNGTFAGYAFAVPSNIVKKVISDIMQYGEVRRGYLGVVIMDLSWQLAQEMGLDLSQGVVVADVVDNGAAAKAGIKIKDVILKINGTNIQSTPQLLEIVAQRRPGDELTVTLQRDGKQQEVEVKLQNAGATRPVNEPALP